jgi:hypothetical protein
MFGDPRHSAVSISHGLALLACIAWARLSPHWCAQAAPWVAFLGWQIHFIVFRLDWRK